MKKFQFRAQTRDEGPLLRYLLFGGDHYYPGGGWCDFLGDFDSIEACRDEIIRVKRCRLMGRPSIPDWSEIVDTETGLVVAKMK